MKPLMLCAVLAVAPALAAAAETKPRTAPPAPAAAGDLKTDEEKTIYAVGLLMGRNVNALGLTPAEMDVLKRGLDDSTHGAKPVVELEAWGPKIQAFAQARAQARTQPEKERSKGFQEAAAKEEGAVRMASGVIRRTLAAGTGDSPAPSDTVKVHYQGSLTNGTVFDSSVQRGEPVELKLDGVIPCWSEGVQKMKVGEKVRLVCPSETAYGDQGRPPVIPGGATLVFEVQLIEIKKTAN